LRLDALVETVEPARMMMSPRLLLLSAVAVAALSLAACATPAPEALRPSQGVAGGDSEASTYGLFLAGRAALNGGQGDQAADYLARAARAEPGATFLEERAFTAALIGGDVHRAASLAPTGADASLSMQRLGRLAQAVDAMALGKGRDAEALLAGDPLGPPHRAAGVLLMPWAAAQAGDWKAALTPPDARGDRLIAEVSLLDLALLYERNHRYDDADAAFRKLMSDGDGANLYTAAYGEFMERRGRKADAVGLYDAALKGDPASRSARIARARAVAGQAPPPAPSLNQGAAQALLAPAALFLAEKQPELGLAYLRLVLRLDPDRNEAWLLVGDAMIAAGDLNAGRAAYMRPKPGSPDYVGARARLIDTYQDAGDAALVLKLAQDTVKGAPGDDDALTLLADALRTDQQFQQSADVLDKLIADHGDHATWDLYYMRGVALEQAGRWPDAERDLKKALVMKPDEPDILNYLGYSWVDRGEQVKEGKAMIEKALAIKPDSGAMIDSLGWAYYKLGDYPQAVLQLERAAELEAADPEINDHLGDAYWRAGRRVEARFQWDLVLTLHPDDKLRAEVEAKLKNGGPGPDGKPARPASATIAAAR
jgi:tetratricopeptide (TPR) repeat protein